MQTSGTEEPEITLAGKMWKRLRLNQRNKRVEAGGWKMRWGRRGRGEVRGGEEIVSAKGECVLCVC